MLVSSLDHVNIRTANLQAMIDWYTKFLGLKNGPRPDFGFPGAWMYLGELPIVHMVAAENGGGAGSEQDLKLEHFAFRGNSWSEFKHLLETNGAPYKLQTIEEVDILQCNIWDPDQNHIHVDFPLSESGPIN
ncbi:MAG: VOC family protein [Alphaproteobacteria bacterium]|nr:VOC family protein [Alphaproteobacteria bacterium]